MLSHRRSDSGVPPQTGLHRLMVILVLGIGGIWFTAWMTKPMELPSDLSASQAGVIIIRPLETGNNPYQREYDEMLYPTVRIETLTGCGSGVVIPSSIAEKFNSSKETREQLNNSTVELFVLTAAHVVGNYKEVKVEIYNGINSLCLNAFVAVTDTNKDLALIRVIRSIRDIRVKDIYSAKLAPKDYQPYLFTPVWAVGCSLGLPPRPSYGYLCALAVDSWEVSAPILPGNSGGGVLAADTHELIGIAVWVRLYGDQLVTTMAGIVPISEVYGFLDKVPELKSSNVQKKTIELLNV